MKKNKVDTYEMIDFCHNSIFLASDFIKKEVEKRLSKIEFFPQPIKRIDDVELIDATYLVSEYIDAQRYLLYLTNINKNKYSILVNITNIMNPEVYILNLRFSENLYYGTLLDCNLVYNNKNCWILLISNIFLYNDKYIFNDRMSSKLNLINDILKNNYVYDDAMNPFYIMLRSYYTLNHLEYIDSNKQLLFYPEDSCKKIYIIDVEIEENKNEEYDSGDYLLIKDDDMPDIYKIYTSDNKKTFVNILSIKSLECSKKLKTFFSDKKEIKIYCTFDKKENEWTINI